VLLVEDDPNDVLLVQRAFRLANLAHVILSERPEVGNHEQVL